ncbi:MAG TPA: hypothetical protein VFU23_17190 [Gemmatimonadales bacterium]|nr:hypothetical protein [Gemmatimonadales bacterium]
MRVSSLATLPLLLALAVGPRQAQAQVSVSVHFGPPIVVSNYAPDIYGDWRDSYMDWRPVTVYFYDGRWYPRPFREARPVVVYRYYNSYFLPPQDQGWYNRDRRYNYRRRPSNDDYRFAAPPPARRLHNKHARPRRPND